MKDQIYNGKLAAKQRKQGTTVFGFGDINKIDEREDESMNMSEDDKRHSNKYNNNIGNKKGG